MSKICNKCGSGKSKEYFRKGRNKCKICERDENKNRMQKLRDNNPEKYRLKSAKWRDENREKSKATVKKSTDKLRENNPQKIKDRQSRYESKYPDRVKNSKNKWEIKNKDKIKYRKKQYRKENRELCVLHCRNRRARKKNAPGNGATLSELIVLYGNECYLKLKGCGMKPTSVEHVIPLSRGGTNYVENLRPACKNCNDKKGKRTYDELIKYHTDQFLNDPHTFTI